MFDGGVNETQAGRQQGYGLLWLLLALACFFMAVLSAFVLWHLFFEPIREPVKSFAYVRSWAELFYFAAGIGLLFTAIFAIFGASAQLKLLNRSINTDVRHGNAAVFLEIEARWSSSEMVTSRQKIGALWSEKNPDKKDAPDIRAAFQTHLRGKLANADKATYMELMRPIYYLETIGLMCEREYLERDDVHELIGPALKDYDIIFSDHIRERREASGDTPDEIEKVDLFGNALRLIERYVARFHENV